MEEQLLNNGFTESFIDNFKALVKDNVTILIYRSDSGHLMYQPRVTYQAMDSNLTPQLDRIETIHDLNDILDHYRDKHEGKTPFIDNLIEY